MIKKKFWAERELYEYLLLGKVTNEAKKRVKVCWEHKWRKQNLKKVRKREFRWYLYIIRENFKTFKNLKSSKYFYFMTKMGRIVWKMKYQEKSKNSC